MAGFARPISVSVLLHGTVSRAREADSQPLFLHSKAVAVLTQQVLRLSHAARPVSRWLRGCPFVRCLKCLLLLSLMVRDSWSFCSRCKPDW